MGAPILGAMTLRGALLLPALSILGCAAEPQVPSTPDLFGRVVEQEPLLQGVLVPTGEGDLRAARVAVVPAAGCEAGRNGRFRQASTSAAADGTFRLRVPPGTYHLMARHPCGMVEIEDLSVRGPLDLGRLDLAPSSDLAVRVVSAEGGAAEPDFMVRGLSWYGEVLPGSVEAARKRLFELTGWQLDDSDDSVFARALPRGRYYLSVDARGFLAKGQEVSVGDRGAVRETIRLRPAMLVAVTLELGVPRDPEERYQLCQVDDDGQSFAGGVSAFVDGTEGPGEEIELLPGNYRVDARHRTNPTVRELDLARFRILPGQTRVEVEVPRTDLRIEVVEAGMAIEGASVRIVNLSGDRPMGAELDRTDAHGHTGIRVRPGRYAIEVRPLAGQVQHREVEVEPGTKTVQIELPIASLSGRLTRLDGAPVMGGEVLLVEEWVDAQGSPRRGAAGGSTARLDADLAGLRVACGGGGGFMVQHLRPGTYHLIGTAEGCAYAYATAGPITVGEESIGKLEVLLPEECRIDLRYAGSTESGDLVRGDGLSALLWLDELRYRNGRARDLPECDFTWAKLDPGSYRIQLLRLLRPEGELGRYEVLLDEELEVGDGRRSIVVPWGEESDGS